MNTRRDFLKLGALWAPALLAPRVAYSFLTPAKERWAVAEAGMVLQWDGGTVRWIAMRYLMRDFLAEDQRRFLARRPL